MLRLHAATALCLRQPKEHRTLRVPSNRQGAEIIHRSSARLGLCIRRACVVGCPAAGTHPDQDDRPDLPSQVVDTENNIDVDLFVFEWPWARSAAFTSQDCNSHIDVVIITIPAHNTNKVRVDPDADLQSP